MSEEVGEHRLPANAWESLSANFRPQPAIPSALVFFFLVLLPIMGQVAGNLSAGRAILVAIGIACSSGLAVAAGFCSLFPQLLWLLLASWLVSDARFAMLPLFDQVLLIAGFLATSTMFVVQIWRIRTGRFVPTIRVD